MDRVGQQIGNYRLIRLLGSGGFAEVYLGEHIYLKTFAGVKILQAQLTTPRALADFLQEGQNIARLVHPYIIRVLDFGVEGDVPYLVMEHAPNGTLRQRYAKRTPLPVQQVIAYTNQVASALQYAHDQRLIHRDVKPENMLLSATGTILLSDFGISTVARTSRSLSTQDISGTVAYMAPEQLQGKVGIASDQYALAVVVYEWLTGKLPFSGSFAEMASQHMFVHPPPLSATVPGLSKDLEQVVMTGLAKTPGERFAHIESFARALEAAGSDDSPTYFTPFPAQDSRSPQQRQREIPPAASGLLPTVQATPAPSAFVPTKATPVPDAFAPIQGTTMPDTFTPNQVTPTPGSMYAPQPAPRSYSRRALFVGIAGAMVVAVAAGVGITYEVLSQQHSPTQPVIGPGTSPPTPSQPTTVTTGQVLTIYTGNHYSVGCAAWSPNALRVASSGLNVQVWDALKGTNVVSYNGHSSLVEAVDWSPDGGSLVSGGDDRTLRTWDAATGATNRTLTGHTDIVWTVAWSPDGNYLASGSGDGRVGVWDARQGTNLFFYQGHKDTVYAVSFSANSQRIASASYDTTVQVWQTVDGSNAFTYTRHNGHVTAVAWAPANADNTSYIASASSDTTVHVWDANNNGSLVTRYTQHASTVNALSWSPNGRAIVSGDGQGQVHVWEVASGNTLYTYTRHTDAINWVTWSPDGQYIASASRDQSVQVWKAPN